MDILRYSHLDPSAIPDFTDYVDSGGFDIQPLHRTTALIFVWFKSQLLPVQHLLHGDETNVCSPAMMFVCHSNSVHIHVGHRLFPSNPCCTMIGQERCAVSVDIHQILFFTIMPVSNRTVLMFVMLLIFNIWGNLSTNFTTSVVP